MPGLHRLRLQFAHAFAAVALLSIVVSAEPATAGDDAPITNDELRAAVARSLPLLEKAARGHRKQRECFACHNQGLPIMALTEARSRGFEINEKELKRHGRFIVRFLDLNREKYLIGKGQGGQVDTAGYALLALEAAEWKSSDTTAAVAEYLLERDSNTDHWITNSKRPPSEASQFTTTYVGLRGLQSYGTREQKDRIDDRTKTVRGWFSATPAADHEDRVFRLLGLKASGAPAEEIESAARELIQSQRDDGGWAQLEDMQSDAYATGTALVALSQTSDIACDERFYQRGLRYLIDTQLEDGSWRVATRSRPFQTYFETGFPHGADQFISCAASGWATLALLAAYDP